MMKVSLNDWIVFNACAVTNYVYLMGFIVNKISGNKLIMHSALLPMFFFGGMGLFIFPWNGIYNLIPQMSHIIMILTVLITVISTYKNKVFREAFLGCIIGIVIFSGFITYQQRYAYSNPEKMDKIIGISIDNN
jgi:hypothetical protein